MAGSRRRSPDVTDDRGRLVLAAVLTATMTAGTLTQFVLGALGPSLTSALGLSGFQFGVLHTGYFAMAALASWCVGPYAARWGTRRSLTAMLAWQTVALVSMGLTRSYIALLVAVAVSGVAAAGSNPVTNRLVMERLPPTEQGLVTGIKQSGPWLGAVLAGVVLGPVAAQMGPAAGFFLAAGCVVAIWVGSGLALGPRPVQTARASATTVALPPGIRSMIPYAIMMGIGGSGLTAYLVLFAREWMGFSGRAAGYTLGLLGVAAVTGRIVWGRRTERWPWAVSPLVVIAGLAGLSAALLAVASGLRLSPLVWLAVPSLGITASSWNAVAMMTVVRTSTVESSGHASGVVVAGFYLGLLFGPVLMGLVLDATGSYTIAWALLSLSFFAAGGFQRRAEPPDEPIVGL